MTRQAPGAEPFSDQTARERHNVMRVVMKLEMVVVIHMEMEIVMQVEMLMEIEMVEC